MSREWSEVDELDVLGQVEDICGLGGQGLEPLDVPTISKLDACPSERVAPPLESAPVDTESKPPMVNPPVWTPRAAVAPLSGGRRQRHRPHASGPSAETADVATESSPMLALIHLVDRLTQRVGALEAEKAEAIAAGRHVVAQRDALAGQLAQAIAGLQRSNADVRRLHGALDHVLDEVVSVATSPLALPVRRRLRAVLAV